MKKKIISSFIAFVLFFLCFAVLPVGKQKTYAKNPELNISNEKLEIVSQKQFILFMAKIDKVSFREALKYDLIMTKKFEQKHPEIFNNSLKAENYSSGHYEYAYISRYVYFGPTYGGGQIWIREVVPTKIYVNGSFRYFVYAHSPFTQPYTGNYTWHQSYGNTDLDSPIQFTAMCSGYAEVAIDRSETNSIGIELEGSGFTLSFTQGNTFYYRKICDFPTWTYSLYP